MTDKPSARDFHATASPRSWWQRLTTFWSPRPSQPPAVRETSAAASAPTSAAAAPAEDYRTIAAQHLYACNTARIFHGQLPPMLHAVAVLELQLTPSGHIQHLDWMRAPQHAPQVMADIEQIVRAAAPFPPTRQAGNFRYIETWLWDASGQFQLRTLTEGQRASD